MSIVNLFAVVVVAREAAVAAARGGGGMSICTLKWRDRRRLSRRLAAVIEALQRTATLLSYALWGGGLYLFENHG